MTNASRSRQEINAYIYDNTYQDSHIKIQLLDKHYVIKLHISTLEWVFLFNKGEVKFYAINTLFIRLLMIAE